LSSSSIYVTLGTTGGATWYADADGDQLGDLNITKVQCTQPSGYVSNNKDQCPNEYSLEPDGCPVNTSVLSNENYIYTITPKIPTTDSSSLTDS
jgi:hypothetical protein